MSNPNAANVIAGKPAITGGASTAPLGTVAPTDATTVLPAAYKALGHIGDNGLEEMVNRTFDKKKAWGGEIVKQSQTEFGVEFKLTLLETLNTDVLKAVHGDGNVTTTPATSTKGTLNKVTVDAMELPPKSWVFEIRDGSARLRFHVPIGQVTGVSAVKYSESDITGYELTISASPDLNGKYVYKFIDDGVTTGA